MLFGTNNKIYPSTVGGYTIIELVVAIGLFVIAALVASSAFLGVMTSNRKALAMRTAMDNLNSAIESMSRDMKTGSVYHCGSAGSIGTALDCPGGDSYIALEGQNGNPSLLGDQIIYRLGPAGSNCLSQQICRSDNGGASFFAVTAPPPELHVTGLTFRVFGSSNADTKQPRIVIVIIGYAGVGTSKSIFNIETTVSQRNPDQI